MDAATRNTARAAAGSYVGTATCAECHAEIAQSFAKTRMGHSLTPVTAKVLKSLRLPDHSTQDTQNRTFSTFSRGNKLYQSESSETTSGEGSFANAQEVRWIVGAGANGYSALVERGNFLFEAPLSYYTKTEKWELSPGYESHDIGFNRPIASGCIACHSGRTNLDQAMTGRFATQPFEQEQIGCENCHGPGSRHVQAMRRDDLSLGTRIVNPARLTAELENDICMSCHEAGDARVPRPGKTYKDFRPGEPLDETVSIFMVPLKRGDPDDHDHVQHYFEMSMSRCFRGSQGKLRCASCHDPHFEPSAEEEPAYFNGKCLRCHSTHACTAQPDARRSTRPADNCIGCHMPKRDAVETAHTSLTNHRILRKPGEAWPDQAFKLTTPALPDLVHVNRAVSGEDKVPALSLLEAYREIEERRPEYAASFAKTLRELEEDDPDHAEVQRELGIRELKANQPGQAVVHLQHAIQLDPNAGLSYSYLSEALAQHGRLDEAIEASEKATSLEPFNPLYQKALVDRLIAAKEYDKALAAMQSYMEKFPEDDFMRRMLSIASQ